MTSSRPSDAATACFKAVTFQDRDDLLVSTSEGIMLLPVHLADCTCRATFCQLLSAL